MGDQRQKYDSVHEALLAAIQDMPAQLEKDGEIIIGKGKDQKKIPYTSIDKFYEQTRKHFLDHGIIPFMSQTGVTEKHFDPVEGVDQQSGQKIMVRTPSRYMIHYKMWFEYFGEKSSKVEHSHLVSLHPNKSPEQQYGGGRSYAWKYLVRSICMLATGDPDADDMATALKNQKETIVTSELNPEDQMNAMRNRAMSAYQERFPGNGQLVASWVLSNVKDASEKQFAHYNDTHLRVLYDWLKMIKGHDVQQSVLSAIRGGMPVKEWGNAFRGVNEMKDEGTSSPASAAPSHDEIPPPRDNDSPPPNSDQPPDWFDDQYLQGSAEVNPKQEPSSKEESTSAPNPKPQTVADRKAAVAQWLLTYGFSGRLKQGELLRWVCGREGITRSTMKHEDLKRFEHFMETIAHLGDPEETNKHVNDALKSGEDHVDYLTRV